MCTNHQPPPYSRVAVVRRRGQSQHQDLLRGMALVERFTREKKVRQQQQEPQVTTTRDFRERYVRNDVEAGMLQGKVLSFDGLGALSRLRESGEPYGFVVPDTNVALHQMDVLEAMERVVLTQTVYEETRRRDPDVAKRLSASFFSYIHIRKGVLIGGRLEKLLSSFISVPQERKFLSRGLSFVRVAVGLFVVSYCLFSPKRRRGTLTIILLSRDGLGREKGLRGAGERALRRCGHRFARSRREPERP